MSCKQTLVSLAFLYLGFSALADEKESANKSHYTFLNPTPRELWRPLAPDRPDTTESPITVDAGAWVLEASFYDFRRNQGTDTHIAMQNNIKLGLTNRIDFQTVFNTYESSTDLAGNTTAGFSDLQFRFKYNVWGNDGGETAFALFPYISVPTGTAVSSGKFEGGLIMPFSTELTDGIGLGLMGQIDAVYDEDTDDHHAQFLHSAVLGFDLTDQWGLYTEYVGVTGPKSYQAYLSGGLTFAVSEDLVFDCGGQFGLNEAADDVGIFMGVTKRF